jgi:hypothetical protein
MDDLRQRMHASMPPDAGHGWPTTACALERAGKEGWPQPGVAPPPGLASRVLACLRARVAFRAGRDELTLEQLYERLLRISIRDRSTRARLDALMSVIAADISDAKRFPLRGVPAVVARPMSAWRERYGVIDRV